MSRPLDGLVRAAGWIGWGLVAASLVALAWLWTADRHRAWPAPRWEAAAFTALRSPAGPPDTLETWMVVVQPLCAHCAASLRATLQRRARTAPRPHVAVLLVDTPEPLARRALAALPPGVERVAWDTRNVWRGRWGHRAYGEVLRFGADGRWRGGLERGP